MAVFTHHVFICGNTRDAAHPRGSCDPTGGQSLKDAFKVELSRPGMTRP